MRGRRIVGVVLVLSLLPEVADAQRDFDAERFHPTLDRFGFLGFQGTTTPGHKRWNLGLWTDYLKSPLKIPGAAPNRTAIEHRLGADVQFQVGLGGRGALAVELPFVMYQWGNDAVLGGASLTGAALGDPRVTGRVRVYGDPSDQNTDRADGPGVALLAMVPIPVGTEKRFASQGQFTFDLHALADFHILGTGAGIMLGWRYRNDEVTIGTATLEQEMLYGFGLKLPIPAIANLFGITELRGSTSFRGRKTNTLEGDLGARFIKGGFTISGAIGTGFVRGLGTPTLRVIVGMTWRMETKDADMDGIPDDKDECPRLPEDFDGFQDTDGCPDPDNDNDMIPDVDDKCPNDEALEGRDEDEDGCTDPS